MYAVKKVDETNLSMKCANGKIQYSGFEIFAYFFNGPV